VDRLSRLSFQQFLRCAYLGSRKAAQVTHLLDFIAQKRVSQVPAIPARCSSSQSQFAADLFVWDRALAWVAEPPETLGNVTPVLGIEVFGLLLKAAEVFLGHYHKAPAGEFHGLQGRGILSSCLSVIVPPEEEKVMAAALPGVCMHPFRLARPRAAR
jgi:hypothetical protein